MASMAKLMLVGAGPGDPDLITMKGMRAIQEARVILYDALASEALLRYAPRDCKLVNVGKRKGMASAIQEHIHALILYYIHSGITVVRLKGGDPFVFGRGHEEWEFAAQHGIDVEYIPGISSSIAAPASAGIPLTKRGVNESFWVITGTLANGALAADLRLAAQSTATVIILMGMSHLEQIAGLFRKHRSDGEPIAIIQNATRADCKWVRGNVSDIGQRAAAQGIESPAVIVIGKVVEESLLIDYIQRQKSLAA
jgi:uroporphyrin-III C-methyltransferase